MAAYQNMNSNPSPTLLTQLAETRYEDVQLAIANSANATEGIFVQLVQSRSESVRRSALSSLLQDDASATLLTRLARTPYENVQYEVAKHSNTPGQALVQLAQSRFNTVRQVAVSQILNSNPSSKLLTQLADAIASSIRQIPKIRGEPIYEEYWGPGCCSPRYDYDPRYNYPEPERQLVGYEYVLNSGAINRIIEELPKELKELVRKRSGSLKHNPEVKW